MPYVITEPCIGVKDGACVEVCPVKAVYNEPRVPKKWLAYIEINRAYFLRGSVS